MTAYRRLAWVMLGVCLIALGVLAGAVGRLVGG